MTLEFISEKSILPSLSFHSPKNSLNDFIFRCKLPTSEHSSLENHVSFWDYLGFSDQEIKWLLISLSLFVHFTSFISELGFFSRCFSFYGQLMLL